MGIITEIDFSKLDSISEKHGITPKKAFEIWSDIHAISEQVKTANAPLEKLRNVHADIEEFLRGLDAMSTFKES